MKAITQLGLDLDFREAARQADFEWYVADLLLAWRDAERAATIAYEHWCNESSGEAYSAYRAAGDQEEAAAHALALAAPRPEASSR
jgi:hypothetical protein